MKQKMHTPAMDPMMQAMPKKMPMQGDKPKAEAVRAKAAKKAKGVGRHARDTRGFAD